MTFYIFIPARYHSSRLPGKPLCDLGGKTMLARVIEQCIQSKATECCVLTDHDAIYAHAQMLGVNVYKTPASCQSGTERIASIVNQKSFDSDSIILNVQGDEPFIHPEAINQLADLLLANPDASVATLYQTITQEEDYLSPHCVKVVLNHQQEALYFSRAPIPFLRQESKQKSLMPSAFKHIGLYAYRASFFERLRDIPSSSLEIAESLEQLRWLQAGEKIICGKAKHEAMMDINTPEDLSKAQKMYEHCTTV